METFQQLTGITNKIKTSAIEVVKVFSSMALVFVVLALIGPLTHAIQQFDSFL